MYLIFKLKSPSSQHEIDKTKTSYKENAIALHVSTTTTTKTQSDSETISANELCGTEMILYTDLKYMVFQKIDTEQ